MKGESFILEKILISLQLHSLREDFANDPAATLKAVAAMGYGENYLRLPLTPMEEANWTKLAAIMRERGIIA